MMDFGCEACISIPSSQLGGGKKTEYPHPVFSLLLNCVLFHLRCPKYTFLS